MSVSESLERVESGPAFEVWRLRSTTMRIEWPRPGTVALAVAGHAHAELVAPCLRRTDEALRRSERLTLLADFWDLPTYDSEFRLALTECAIRNRARLDPVHVLTRSQLVSMGVAVANLSLGGLIKVYTLRASYEVAIQRIGVPRGRGPSK